MPNDDLLSTIKADVPTATVARPVSPHYRPLEWGRNEPDPDPDDEITADGDDWTYRIAPIISDEESVIGYRVSGGDYESGSDLGTELIDGARGERTLEGAKAAAEEDYASRYVEVEGLLHNTLDGYEDESGNRTHVNKQGRVVCPVSVPGLTEVKIVVTLVDEADSYDAVNSQLTLCLRTLIRCDGDPGLLVENIEFYIARYTGGQ